MTITHFEGGKNKTTDYRPDVKANTAPVIIDTYIDDDTGDTWFNLANGNSISQVRYDAVWNVKKGIMKPMGFKGDNLDTRRVCR